MGRAARLKRCRRLASEEEVPVPATIRAREVSLIGTVERLRLILSEALCLEVFKSVRDKERQRVWSLPTLAYFWLGVVLRSPRSLAVAFSEAVAAKGESQIWPRIRGSPTAFFKRTLTLRPRFFAALYHRLVEGLLAQAPATFCSSLSSLREHFPEVWAIDGSRLEAVAHRLKILWDVRSAILPGCVTALYDLYRGIPRRLEFYADAAKSEFKRACELLDDVPKGVLLVGDRLYASVALFADLDTRGLFGLFRAKKNLVVERIGLIVRKTLDGGVLEDWFVNVGSGQKTTPQTLRFIRYRKGKISIKLFTNVLDEKKLSAEMALRLYRHRWSIERMYFDLKETLGLNRFHSANPNGVAMQVFATAMVYAAMRVGQAEIAAENGIVPEMISPAKLLPRLAKASADHAEYLCGVHTVVELNPKVDLMLPGPDAYPRYTVKLGDILRQPRNDHRRKRRFCAARAKWKSYAHVRGGSKFIKN